MIDTHAHIDDPQYQDDLDAFIAQQKAEGVELILVPGVDATTIQPVLDVCGKYPDYLLPGIGLHPENVREDWREQLAAIHASLENTNYIAIGEIGLDYHFDTTFKAEQQEALRIQLGWAIARNLPVMIHSRDATEDCLNILREFPGLRGVMHCYSGSNETAKQIIKMGLYLGIGGVITFKNAKLRDNLKGIPLERIVLETDAPYMAPVPYRGQRNESRWMRYVADVLADVYHTTFEQIDTVTTSNAKTLFGLK
ncbi:MAG: TatD family hydrolase [Paludibacteraceae bacterium]|nr:TatD family hydrolase [Paludibacteraceae bacterium]